MAEKINEKWNEEMPVLYEVFMLVQDELLESYKEEHDGLLPGQSEASDAPVKLVFDTPQLA